MLFSVLFMSQNYATIAKCNREIISNHRKINALVLSLWLEEGKYKNTYVQEAHFTLTASII